MGWRSPGFLKKEKTVSKKLTAKEAKFVQEYLIDLNASAAARRAGYSPKTANRTGPENLSKPHIQAALTFARQELSSKSGITPEKVIQGFADLAFADISECYNEDGILKNIHDIPKSCRAALAGIEVFEEFGGKGENKVYLGQTKKVRMWDKHKGLDSLAKHFGLYDADKSNRDNIKFVVCGTTGQSLEQTMKEVGVVEIESE
jgi:phage terminase small subunit